MRMPWRRPAPELVASVTAIAEAMLADRGVTRSISLDEPLGAEGLGFDSVARLDLLARIEKQCGVTIPEKYWGSKSPRNLRHLIEVAKG